MLVGKLFAPLALLLAPSVNAAPTNDSTDYNTVVTSGTYVHAPIHYKDIVRQAHDYCDGMIYTKSHATFMSALSSAGQAVYNNELAAYTKGQHKCVAPKTPKTG